MRSIGTAPERIGLHERLGRAYALVQDLRRSRRAFEQIRAALGELLEERGEHEEADEAFSRAAGTPRALAEKVGDQRLRSGFLSASRVRRVLDAVPVAGEREAP